LNSEFPPPPPGPLGPQGLAIKGNLKINGSVNKYLFSFPEENLELMEDLNAIDLIVDAIKMHKKVG